MIRRVVVEMEEMLCSCSPSEYEIRCVGSALTIRCLKCERSLERSRPLMVCKAVESETPGR